MKETSLKRAGRTVSTPWGVADFETVYGDGVTFYTTPSHGGFHLSPARLAEMPACLRVNHYGGGSWFEEDCEACLVCLAFPDLFDGRAVHAAVATVKSWYASAWAMFAKLPQAQRVLQMAEAWLAVNGSKYEFGGQWGNPDGCGGIVRRVDGGDWRAYRCKEWPALRGPFTLDEARAAGLTISPVA